MAGSRWAVLLVLTLSLGLLSTLPAAAQVEKGDGSLGFGVGLTFLDDDISDDDGFRYDLRGGYFLGQAFELEGQVTRSTADEAGLDISLDTFFVNAVFNFRPANRVVPYTLIGVGLARLEAEGGGFQADDSSLAFQSALGLRIFFGQESRAAARVEISAFTEDTFDDSSQHFALSGGLSWRFGR